MITPTFRVIAEIDGDFVTEQQIEYSYCLHCYRFYDRHLPVLAAKLSKTIIWWHYTHCPPWYTDVEDILIPATPPCALNLCDGSGRLPLLYQTQNPLCFCKRP